MDERIWTDHPLTGQESLLLDGVTVTLGAPPQAAYLISGNIAAGVAALGPNAPVLGLIGDCGGLERYGLRIARHSVLFVSDSGAEIETGWDKGGFGVSDAHDVYARFEITGPRAEMILAENGVIAGTSSASAAIQFGGITVLLVQCGEGFHLWVPRGMMTYVTSVLRRFVGHEHGFG